MDIILYSLLNILKSNLNLGVTVSKFDNADRRSVLTRQWFLHAMAYYTAVIRKPFCLIHIMGQKGRVVNKK